MNISKPKFPQSDRPLCPHCGKPTYSRGGIHPQCAVHLADAIDQKATGDSPRDPKPPTKRLWIKRCPRCRREVAARRFVCDCGHPFIAKTKD